MDRETQFKTVVESNQDRIYRICCCYIRDEAEARHRFMGPQACWLAGSQFGSLAQPVPHHFSGIARAPDEMVTLSLDGSVSNLIPGLTGTISNQFMQAFDLYLVEASTNLVDWTRLATLLQTNDDANPLLPALSRSKSAADSAVCKSNLRQWGLALQMHLDELGVYPQVFSGEEGVPEGGGGHWFQQLARYAGAPEFRDWDWYSQRERQLHNTIYSCPSDARIWRRHRASVPTASPLSADPRPGSQAGKGFSTRTPS